MTPDEIDAELAAMQREGAEFYELMKREVSEFCKLMNQRLDRLEARYLESSRRPR